MPYPISKYQAATTIAIVFHIIGLIGILFFSGTFFINSTPFNLLLSAALLVWTQKKRNKSFCAFIALTIIIGFAVEVIGVNTGWLFGNYNYGKVLGLKLMEVPVLIGVNWFIIIYCCGITMHTLLIKLIGQVAAQTKAPPPALKAISVIADGATLAVLFDWILEPVAVKLGFWQWQGSGGVPLYNYICWVMISLLLLTFFHFLKFEKQNKFAINLLLIQCMFFLLLRTFSK